MLSIVPYDPERDSLRALVDLGLKDKLKDRRELEEILQGVAVKPRPGENTSICWLWDTMVVSPFLSLHILLKAEGHSSTDRVFVIPVSIGKTFN